MSTVEEVLGIKKATAFAKLERVETLKFGMHYLDRVTQGILPQDIILLAAGTGLGKTELAYTICASVAKQGKRVLLLALESEYGEFENRTIFRELAGEYYANGGTSYVDYLSWRLGKCPQLEKYREVVMPRLSYMDNIHVYYRTGKFDIDDFTRVFAAMDKKVSFACLDHLQFLDINDDKSENKQVTEIMMRIRDLAQIQNCPVLVVNHLRKLPRSEKILVPDESDLFGSSNIPKIATKIITLGADGIDEETGYPATLIRLAKFRMAGERTKVVGRLVFNTTTNSYEKEFMFGYLSPDQKQFIPITEEDKLPRWLK